MTLLGLSRKVVLITGATAGIGLEMAHQFAAQGCSLVLGARRSEKLEALAQEIRSETKVKVWCSALDVQQTGSVESFVAGAFREFGHIDVLVNNAGLALGTDRVADGADSDWEAMLGTNVTGLLRVSRRVIKQWQASLKADASRTGHIINLGSIAGLYAYEGGSAYCASKHAVQAISKVLRLELQGQPIRVTEIDPGMVETEFSQVRFKGDAARAKQVYEGFRPLVAEDVARVAVFAVGQPPHVNLDQIVITPLAQAGLRVDRSK